MPYGLLIIFPYFGVSIILLLKVILISHNSHFASIFGNKLESKLNGLFSSPKPICFATLKFITHSCVYNAQELISGTDRLQNFITHSCVYNAQELISGTDRLQNFITHSCVYNAQELISGTDRLQNFITHSCVYNAQELISGTDRLQNFKY